MVSSRYVPSSGIAGSYGSFTPSFLKESSHCSLDILQWQFTHTSFLLLSTFSQFFSGIFFFNLILFSHSCLYVCVCMHMHVCPCFKGWRYRFFALDNLSLFSCLWKLWWGGSHACDCAYYISDSKDPNNASWLMTRCVLAY